MELTSELIKKAYGLEFEFEGKTITVSDWLKLLLTTLIDEEECFSGKRPFGNSGWKLEVEALFIREGIIKGELDENGYVDKSYESIDPILKAIVESWLFVENWL